MKCPVLGTSSSSDEMRKLLKQVVKVNVFLSEFREAHVFPRRPLMVGYFERQYLLISVRLFFVVTVIAAVLLCLQRE